MIVWTRWGILSALVVGAVVAAVVGIGTGGGDLEDGGNQVGVWAGVGLMVAAVVHGLYVSHVQARFLDRPRELTVQRAVPIEMLVGPDGELQVEDVAVHHSVASQLADPSVSGHLSQTVDMPVRVLDDLGRPVLEYHQSSLFFIPVEYLTQIVGAIGIVVLIGNLLSRS